jgi:hypothetical protein
MERVMNYELGVMSYELKIINSFSGSIPILQVYQNDGLSLRMKRSGMKQSQSLDVGIASLLCERLRQRDATR